MYFCCLIVWFISRRDKIGFELADRANQAQRDKKLKASAARCSLVSPNIGSKNSDKWSTDRLSSMSPAARQLLSSRFGVRQATDSLLRRSYTPSRSHTPSPYNFTKTPTPKGKRGSCSPWLGGKAATPSSGAKMSVNSGTCSLTDGLLQLPNRSADAKNNNAKKRNCAADFFWIICLQKR